MTTPTQTIADADVAAAFFRTLVAGGVPEIHAKDMASSYLSSVLFNRSYNGKTKPPWETP